MIRRVCLLVSLLLGTPVANAADWEPLFNHTDLTGWKANNDPTSFQVEDGVLRVQAAAGTSAHLFVVDPKTGDLRQFKNFELEAVARAEPHSNGGLFVHTDMSTRDSALHLAKGYEVQLNSTAKEKRKTGSLYAIDDRTESPVDETKWFTVNVLVEGKRIRIKIADQTCVDYTEPVDVKRPPERKGRLFSPTGGAVAIQAHDKGSVWYFKDLKIKQLP